MFDHCRWGRSVTFFSRKKIPTMHLCFIFGLLEKHTHPYNFQVRIYLTINGFKWIQPSCCTTFSIEMNHVWLIDIHDHFINEKINLGYGWNHVEVSCESCPVMCCSLTKQKPNVKWCRIHVYKQESSMEDIQFTTTNTLNH